MTDSFKGTTSRKKLRGNLVNGIRLHLIELKSRIGGIRKPETILKNHLSLPQRRVQNESRLHFKLK